MNSRTIIPACTTWRRKPTSSGKNSPTPVYPIALDYVAGMVSPLHEVQIADLLLRSTARRGWQWLLQALAAQKALKINPTGTDINFYQGKLYTFRYFFQYELPKSEGLAKSLLASSRITVEMKKDFF